MSILIQYLTIFLFSTFKFAFSCFAAVGNGFNFLETFIITALGGITGVLIFAYLTRPLTKLWFYTLKVFGYDPDNKVQKPLNKKRYKRNRKLVRIKKSYGLIGLAVITPSLLSIPVGAFVAVKFYGKNSKTLLIMMAAVIFWSVVFSALALFNVSFADVLDLFR